MKRLFLIVCMLLLFAPVVFGLPGLKPWYLEWNANTDTDLAGYKVYYRNVGEQFGDAKSIDVGKVTRILATGAVPYGSEVAITAYDTSGNESEFSVILPFDKDGTSPGVPQGNRWNNK